MSSRAGPVNGRVRETSERQGRRDQGVVSDDRQVILASSVALPAFVVPGADFPPWAPWVFGAIGLVTVAVLVYQAVRYFRDNRNDKGRD